MKMKTTASSPAAPWWASETPVRLSQAPALLPPAFGGGSVHAATIYRWCTAGIGGVVLRRFRAGGCWATTAQELTRFQLALTEARL